MRKPFADDQHVTRDMYRYLGDRMRAIGTGDVDGEQLVTELGAAAKAVLRKEIDAFGTILGKQRAEDGTELVWVALHGMAFRIPVTDLCEATQRDIREQALDLTHRANIIICIAHDDPTAEAE